MFFSDPRIAQIVKHARLSLHECSMFVESTRWGNPTPEECLRFIENLEVVRHILSQETFDRGTPEELMKQFAFLLSPVGFFNWFICLVFTARDKMKREEYVQIMDEVCMEVLATYAADNGARVTPDMEKRAYRFVKEAISFYEAAGRERQIEAKVSPAPRRVVSAQPSKKMNVICSARPGSMDLSAAI